ncbi:MAG: heavy-metal-associated domain-containing protein [Nitrospiria bacterium]
MQKTIIDIEGMTCDHCVRAVAQVLEGIESVSDVSVSLSEKTARLTYDEGKTTLSEITQAIEAEEYEVKGTR